MNSSIVISSDSQNTSAEILGLGGECNSSITSNGTQNCTIAANVTRTVFGDNLAGFMKVLELVFSCFDIIAIVGNILLAVVIYKASKLKDAPGRLMMNQVIADGGFILGYIILNVFYSTTSDINLILTVMVVQKVSTFIFIAESMQTQAMTLYTLHLAICCPIRYKLQSKTKHVVIFLVISWLINIATWLPMILIEDMYIKGEVAGQPMATFNINKHNAWFVCMIFILGYIAPLIAIITSYIRITRQLKGSQNSVVKGQSTTTALVQKARGILFISVVFTLMTIPLFMFELLGTSITVFGLSEDSLIILWIILAIIIYTYMTVKFPLFLLAFKSYRQVVGAWCRCKTRVSRQGNIQSGTVQDTDIGKSHEGTDKVVGRDRQEGTVQDTNGETKPTEMKSHHQNLTETCRPQGCTNDGYDGSPEYRVTGIEDGHTSGCVAGINRI